LRIERGGSSSYRLLASVKGKVQKPVKCKYERRLCSLSESEGLANVLAVNKIVGKGAILNGR